MLTALRPAAAPPPASSSPPHLHLSERHCHSNGPIFPVELQEMKKEMEVKTASDDSNNFLNSSSNKRMEMNSVLKAARSVAIEEVLRPSSITTKGFGAPSPEEVSWDTLAALPSYAAL